RADHLLDEQVGNPVRREVPREHEGFAGYLARGLRGDVAVEVVDQDLRAVFREQLRSRAPDSACRAGDDRHLVIEDGHVSSPPYSDMRLGIMPVLGPTRRHATPTRWRRR